MSALIMLLFGVAMSFNAIGTQSMRRKVTNTSEFAEVVGLELIVSRAVEWLVVTFLVAFIKDSSASVSMSFLMTGLGFFLIALYALSLKESDLKAASTNRS